MDLPGKEGKRKKNQMAEWNEKRRVERLKMGAVGGRGLRTADCL